MKRLITISEETFGRPQPVAAIRRRKRQAARAVLLTEKNEVYVLHVTAHGHHKLPGGGIEEGEDIVRALEREILEEVGCASQVVAEIGEVLEYRNYEDVVLDQYSYCYIAKQVGELGEQKLEQNEIDMGHDLVVTPSIDEAIALLEQDRPFNTEGEYIRLRDLTILKAAKELLDTIKT